MATINATIQIKRATASKWSANNPILASGEWGFETDTKKVKIGDGVNHWNDLPYFNSQNSSVEVIDLGISSMSGTIDSEILAKINECIANNQLMLFKALGRTFNQYVVDGNTLRLGGLGGFDIAETLDIMVGRISLTSGEYTVSLDSYYTSTKVDSLLSNIGSSASTGLFIVDLDNQSNFTLTKEQADAMNNGCMFAFRVTIAENNLYYYFNLEKKETLKFVLLFISGYSTESSGGGFQVVSSSALATVGAALTQLAGSYVFGEGANHIDNLYPFLLISSISMDVPYATNDTRLETNYKELSISESNGDGGYNSLRINVATKEGMDKKQDALVSGTNIKTINGQSLLGSGDLTIETTFATNTEIEALFS